LFVNYYSFSQDRLYSNILVSVQNQPHLLDVVALNASGATVGYVTDHGFARYGSGVYAGDADGYYLAPYIWDTVKFGDIAVDFGVRYTRYHAEGGNYTAGTRNLGDATTLADDSVYGLTGVYSPRTDNRNALNWSAGIQYKFIPQAEVFARYTSAERLPSQSNVYLTDTTPITPIRQAEGGVRVVFDSLSFSATTFWSRFKNLSTSTAIMNTDGSIGTLYLIGDTQTIGEEIDFEWRPVEYFSIQGAATIQNPETQTLANKTTGVPYPGMDGKQLSRIPKYIYSATPTFYYNVFGKPVEVSATVYYMGRRYVDYSNHTELPAFTTIDLNVLAQLTDKIDLRVHAENLTNTKGITEGNPRTDTVGGQETSEVNYGRPIFGAIYKMSLTYKW
jgi:outer membrane receptor protein involved in Fe transport